MKDDMISRKRGRPRLDYAALRDLYLRFRKERPKATQQEIAKEDLGIGSRTLRRILSEEAKNEGHNSFCWGSFPDSSKSKTANNPYEGDAMRAQLWSELMAALGGRGMYSDTLLSVRAVAIKHAISSEQRLAPADFETLLQSVLHEHFDLQTKRGKPDFTSRFLGVPMAAYQLQCKEAPHGAVPARLP